jgi:tetratricopeptide (TPR) repeat protein
MARSLTYGIRASVRWIGLVLLLLAGVRGGFAQEPSGGFLQAMSSAERALDAKDFEHARDWIERALERDARAVEAWKLRARWAEAVGDEDELVFALHRAYANARAQKLPPAQVEQLRKRVLTVDPIAPDLLSLDVVFSKRLFDLAARYEKEGRPHAAITVLKTVLALNPLDEVAQASIERIASRPDPSLAADAKPKDLFADVSREWIKEYDKKHATWDERGSLKRGSRA